MKLLLILAVAIVVSCLVFLVGMRFIYVAPAFPWHVEGTVTDKSSIPLGGVHIIAAGNVEVTGINKLFGTEVKMFRQETNTGREGGFAFNIKASNVHLIFSREGYAEQDTNFSRVATDRGDATNQMLHICLEP